MDKSSSDAYATLTACIARGIHVTVGLLAGEMVMGYRSNDVIAPVRFEVYIDMSKAILRGIVWPYHGEPADRLIRLPGIKTVLEDRLAFRYFSDAGLSQRNPITEGWVRVASCRSTQW